MHSFNKVTASYYPGSEFRVLDFKIWRQIKMANNTEFKTAVVKNPARAYSYIIIYF